MGKVFLTAFPYAMQTGVIEVPEGVEDTVGYIMEHLDEVEFEDPELDYDGVEFEVDEKWGQW